MDIKKDVTTGVEAVYAGQAASIERPKPRSSKSFGNGLKIVFIILLLALILAVAGYLVEKYTGISLLGEENQSQAEEEYSAVFLSNGQVYFGRVGETANRNYTELIDIYYLQAYNPPLQQAANEQSATQPELSLVKLGNELHGPQDRMEINNDHIVFIEHLKTNGKVVEAILKYREGQNQ
ncbi:hypothetical protein COV56_01895 [Candidatus Kuenenbacteria bacterium CG11_big_fil_rev_8_21_14_0_20_37_9]|uniref:Uncharacterized protein n=1 Tax=Candidatus Kuenenbacteria bacterium CG08_land_8_20_14_0_20_37_23 TaxID=1974617 RepID=A0A2M6XTV2_9BACT|nr:MAG: hypothetical protein COV56_01895 [Candidatus Kuenenbacteria bacterium CG11_big_fil_rev_8_21_14_0_20_37_9]PIU11011.1 MAG: hypothetical protein COT27_00100 [Candidatus Kuenenbacteria bacterium CG08_land_8_20_14_0_20_37_23]